MLCCFMRQHFPRIRFCLLKGSVLELNIDPIDYQWGRVCAVFAEVQDEFFFFCGVKSEAIH